VLVNGRFLTRPATGVDRFALELLGALARRRELRGARLAVPRAHAGLTGAAGLPVEATPGRIGLDGHAWEQLQLPAQAGDDWLVNLCNTAPLAHRRQLVVVHDAAAVANPHNYSLAFRSWYRLMLGAVMRRAACVATVSAFSADELTRHFGRRPQGIEVIPEGGEHILRQPADRSVLERLGLGATDGPRYVLAVGSQSPNKNFAAVLQAMDRLDDPNVLLVAAGGGDARIYAPSALAHPRLRRTGYVSDAQLRALYEGAACFVFPSFYEGFGLPPLEAMCCGCPVIVSERASLPEVCGPAALYCDPADPATLAAALRRLLASPALADELRAAGHARAAQLTWDRAASTFTALGQRLARV
jgi:glycosyltransferase involved in cell wall biosynthesis